MCRGTSLCSCSEDEGSVFHSECFDFINESELDTMLEAIKEEESREGTPFKDDISSSSFEWQPLVAPDVANDQLMSQLQLTHKREIEKCHLIVAPDTVTTNEMKTIHCK